ncbi:type 1 fimbrial protein [Klebsiella michiganensis]|uniref:fimbrial protein n=1 Tax=Klebsiella/Raoultella group TaxID=2890311 RepID=UPI001034B80C|nr:MULTISPECIES: fimbrial protein [Klebsiella/Raoultella group]MCF6692624.1 type 1 fimbrial protein [Raoultella terrigena]MEB4603266.1 type 1 fimbrial protein [Raoultella ornithinolytica]MEB7602150.1 type 1 fimbrial protein [Raoultella terrigena]MEB8081406.1 type 1 fimbrial protein [Klebsiella michiganensis]
MRKLNIPFTITIVSSLLCYSIPSVSATCTFSSNSTVKAQFHENMPLAIANLTAGPDVPNGTILYRQTHRQDGKTIQVGCSGSGTTFLDFKVESPGSNGVSSVAGIGLSNGNSGKVYNTNIPGIGIAFWFNFNNFDYRFYQNGLTAASYQYDISLIKTGLISPGAINTSTLPTISVSAGQEGATSLKVMTASLSGSINIVSRTCTTPDVPVDLGVYKISDFPSIGSTSIWKDASIKLTNCPAFYGFYNLNGGDRYVSYSTNNDGTFNRNATNVKNTLGYTLKPTGEIIDNSKGIISLSNTEGLTTAQGLGIQISTGTAADPLNPMSFNTLLSSGVTLASIEGASYTIPLKARYYRTSSLTPGRADGSIIFTINYQ